MSAANTKTPTTYPPCPELRPGIMDEGGGSESGPMLRGGSDLCATIQSLPPVPAPGQRASAPSAPSPVVPAAT